MLNRTFKMAAMVAGSLALGSAANATTYGFQNFTGNNATDAAIGEAQLFMDVNDAGGGLVDFVFTNTGPEASSITQIYWDDASSVLSSAIPSVTNSTGTQFTAGSNSPPNVPGGNTIGFSTNPRMAEAAPDSPTQPNGVNPGEMVTITFSLLSGKTYLDVLASLLLGLDDDGSNSDDGLRVAFHVQGFATGGSESFVNTGPDGNNNNPPKVPLPAGMFLLLTGLGGFGIVAARRRKLTA